MALRQHREQVTIENLLSLMQHVAFDIVAQDTYLPSLGRLRLADVAEIRRTDEWCAYIQALRELLDDPLQFARPDGGARAVYDSFCRLSQRIALLVPDRIVEQVRWLPVVELIFDIAGSTLATRWGPDGIIFQTAGNAVPRVGGHFAPVVVRMVIRNLAKWRTGLEFSTSVEFLHGRMEFAAQQWSDLIARTSELQGFRRGDIGYTQTDAAINPSEEP